MELISHKVCVGEELFNELFVRVTQIKSYVSDVFTSWYVGKSFSERGACFALNDLVGLFIIKVDEHCSKAGSASFRAFAEAMFIDADSFWPRVIELTFSSSLKAFEEGFVNRVVGAAVLLLHFFEIGKSPTGPDQRALKSLGEPLSRQHPGQGLTKYFAAVSTLEPSFSHL